MIIPISPRGTALAKASGTPAMIIALKNLLFPTKNYIDMQDVAAPDEVLLLGNFKKDS
jgi:hypothetical protein